MAEPLLKRTFSRLRSRRRAADPKVSDVCVIQTSSSSSSSSSRVGPTAPSSGQHITVAKKQQWAQQGSSRDALPGNSQASSGGLAGRLPPAPAPSGGLPGRQTPDQDQPSSAGLTGRQTLADDKGCGVRPAVGLDREHSSRSLAQASVCPPRGPYLQSLEHSRRTWVMSSGKAQASDEASRLEPCRGQVERGTIWYNPIPEEEEELLWRRREEEVVLGRRREEEAAGGKGPSTLMQPTEDPTPVSNDVAQPTDDIANQPDEITVEHLELPSSVAPPPESSPSSQKKVGMIDRLKSPGTVRKLSMKMKKLPELRRKLSLRSSRSNRHGNKAEGGEEGPSWTNKETPSLASNQNVLSRYHLDSSAPPARPVRRSSRGRSSKGGYLSDGDSPELLPRQPAGSQRAPEGGYDVSSFRLYVGSEQPRGPQRVSGLLTAHLLGLDEMSKTRCDSGGKEVFLAIQVDGVTRARTSLLTLRGAALPLNHTFHLQLERARQLRLVVLTPQANTDPLTNETHTSASSGPIKNRVCCLGGLSIPLLFKACRSQQLCVKLDPRGLLYVKLSLQEHWSVPSTAPQEGGERVFGVELHHLVDRERTAAPVPILIQKTVKEIERRGIQVVGLYRLCGSAAVKKDLRDSFEKDSSAVCLSEEQYPDINVLTGILKDYLRALPSPLITSRLYDDVLAAMRLRPLQTGPAPPCPAPSGSVNCPVELLDCLPPPEKATLSLLLDHLSLVASFRSSNRMTPQNLAVCFGPVLLASTDGVPAAREGGREAGKDSPPVTAVDFKRHIEVLHYLLALWPVPSGGDPEEEEVDAAPLYGSHPSPPPSPPSPPITHNPLGQQPSRAALRLALPQNPNQQVVVSRRGRGLARLDSPPPINRYAGDWSVCGRDFLSGQDADYDEVAGSGSEEGSDEEEKKEEGWSSGRMFMEEFDAPFSCRLSLKDFDRLILDLDRELAKQINICL
ncbi:rho GTPase-activating protein SYDE1 [Gadus macrocephalus]|uniref:rho GTPase-activating protein SYDE1 n=1 Tax=Gadus macrocephalus TaxID=80720 RepID=UPI0028CB5592|nr:rho GTPase-activating protein SYDE1 [Gadus macrocephalus]